LNLSLLVQLCGLPLVVIVALLSLALTIAACYLLFSVRREELLVAFLPLTGLPALACCFGAWAGALSSISLQLEGQAEVAVDGGLLMQMNLVPLLFGLVACIPPAVIAAVGRWVLAWQASGVELFPGGKHDSATEIIDADTMAAREADEYLEQIISPR
jgi:hypothetical protein